MMTVWHYPLDLTDYQTLTLPLGTELLKLGFEGDQLYVWGMVDPEVKDRVTVAIRMYVTGDSFEIPPPREGSKTRPWRYLDSVTSPRADTWHVFIEL
jgi:hypothetical protein